MKTYQLGLYEKALPKGLTWQERFVLAKEAGFDFIELSIDETDDRLARLEWNLAEQTALAREAHDAGVPLRSICLSGHRKYPLGSKDPAVRERGLEIGFKAVDFASDCGIRLIQLAGYDVYYTQGDLETERLFAEGLKLVTLYAASREVALGFETMETPFMDTVAKAMRYVSEVRNPWLGVYPDIGNLTNAAKLYGHDVRDDIRTGAGHIFAAHLKETVPGSYREVPFGTGHTEYVADLEVLQDLGVRSFVGEFWDVGSENWREDLLFAGRFLRGHLDVVFQQNK